MCSAAILLLLGISACNEPPPKPRNLLLVTVDTLRADRLGHDGYARPTSPNLDALAEQSVVFLDARTPAPWTLPALASLLTGELPSTHGAQGFRDHLRASFDTLPELLGRAGFRSAGIGSHVFLSERYGLQQGFDEFDTTLVSENFANSHRVISSERLTHRALAWLQGVRGDPRPWFLWVHYFDPHELYRLHKGISQRFGLRAPSDRYDGEIAFTDLHIGRLLEGLAALGADADTLVVFSADHGEEFLDHGGSGHGHQLHRELVRVPLLFRIPGQNPRRIESPVSLVDVLPTLLDLLGVEAPAERAGRSLVPLIAGARGEARPLLFESRLRGDLEAIEYDGWKWIRRAGARSGRLYALGSDPGEMRDLAASEPERARDLAQRLDAELAAARSRGAAHAPEAPKTLTPAEAEALRELGYLRD